MDGLNIMDKSRMTNRYDQILAKSDANGALPLTQHLMEVANVAMSIARNVGLNTQTARKCAILHDIGKVSPEFQKTLKPDFVRKPGYIWRHEIASLFFLSLIDQKEREVAVECIVAHHKSVCDDVSDAGFLDLVNYEENCFSRHSKHFDQWMPIANGILEQFGFITHSISLQEAEDNMFWAADYCESKKNGFSIWKGLLMAADHYASAKESIGCSMEADKMFIRPNLSFYNRENSLFPLSVIDTSDIRPHTLLTAPTGAGKTDFLLRRCNGRVFYTLPFQASINAMFERISNDLSGTGAVVQLLHSSSYLKVDEGKIEESILQRHVGSSVKIMTPHQMASIVFGIKGYEAMAIDLMGCDVILDEIHTYSSSIQAIVLRIIEILRELGCRIHVGTATMPTILYNKILKILGGGDNVCEIKLDDKTLQTFDRHIVYKCNSIESVYEKIETAISHHMKILIVCNQVKRAQEIYKQIDDIYPCIEKLLIHSRLKRKDRIKAEMLLKNKFNIMDAACIVVATQVVEVSLDISFDLMITECAPIDAMIQRFGRINRKRTKESIGQYKSVYVIAPPSEKKECLPYDEEILRRSYDVLPENGEIIHETDLQEMIDFVYPDTKFIDIDYSGVIFKDGKWLLKELRHYSKSAFLGVLDINSAVCVTEQDKEEYLHSKLQDRAKLEIPVNFKSVEYKNLETLEVGNRPFVIPDSAYSEELGLLIENVSTANYKMFEMI